MIKLLVLLLAAILATTTLASPLKRQKKCTSPTIRQSWHTLPSSSKKSYLAATKCLLTSPAKLNRMPGAKTRWDELVSLHQIYALQIHSTGQFLPWHRYFLHVHEGLLRECGYEGVQPYWSEPLDALQFSASPIFSPDTGFGGSGSYPNPCVPNGPFANLTVNIGPGFSTTPRCINRQITDFFGYWTSEEAVKIALAAQTYEEMWVGIYGGPHLAGHMALAMMNADSITSPGDPLFMLHHAFIDKLWSDWQLASPSTRLTDIGGPNAQDPAVGFYEFPGGMEEESVMWGKPSAEMEAVRVDGRKGDVDGEGNIGNTTTAGHVLSSAGLIGDATVGDVLDTEGGYLCYRYE